MKEAPAIFALTKKNYLFSGVTLGLGIYCAGLVLCAAYGATSYFLKNWLFAGCCVGIALVVIIGDRYFLSLDEIMNELKSNFTTSEVQFEKNERDFRTGISNDKIILLLSFPGLLIGVYYTRAILGLSITPSMVLPQPLQGNVLFIAYMLALFMFSGYTIFLAIQTVIRILVFLREIAKSPAKLSLLQVGRRINLTKTNNALLALSTAWFIGVSFIMTTLLAFATTVIVIYLATLTIIGLLLFLAPQIFFHQSIRRSKEALLRDIESNFSSKVTLPITPECDPQKALLLCMLFEQVNQIGEWPLSSSLVLQLFGSAVIPIATTIVGLMRF